MSQHNKVILKVGLLIGLDVVLRAFLPHLVCWPYAPAPNAHSWLPYAEKPAV